MMIKMMTVMIMMMIDHLFTWKLIGKFIEKCQQHDFFIQLTNIC